MARSSSAKPAAGRSSRRRGEIRRAIPRQRLDPKMLLQQPGLVNSLLIMGCFIVAVSLIVIWSTEQVKVTVGQLMPETRVKRLDYTVEDTQATEERREEARRESPRIYRRNRTYFDRLRAAFLGLPKAVEGKTTLQEISTELRQEYNLTVDALQALQQFVDQGNPTQQWASAVSRLIDEQLRRNPLVTSDEYQILSTTSPENRKVLPHESEITEQFPSDPIELPRNQPEKVKPKLHEMVERAGFPEVLVPAILHRIVRDLQPTYVYDEQATQRMAEQAAAAVEPVLVQHNKGEIIYERGDVLSATQFHQVQIERAMYAEQASLMQIWLPRAGYFGLIAVMSLFMTAYVAMAYPRITRNNTRTLGIAVLMVAMLLVTVIAVTRAPNLIYFAAIAPTMLVAIIVMLAYDQRLAVFLVAVQSALVALALDGRIAWFVLLLSGCGAMVAQLPEVRNRNSLIRAAAVTSLVLALGAITLGLIRLPFDAGLWITWRTIFFNGIFAAAASFAIGFLVLGILPSIERMFDITTGMTLAELRDPKHPLLRQLQQKAPGTYNHSLQVATIAEAAAEAIGADGLLTYVGALYHDIGKMNKPEYFVENQSEGINKHRKLSPAMSLLVIVGHVKDGIELAREYGLPRKIQHFIESHHGTTLVEYFFHAAKRAEAAEKGQVNEVEFRYPGPKPTTREAAILMLSDAVESATRAMAEPNPSRITALVRELSRKRLMDGQFDQSPLTFQELTIVEEAITSRVLSMHHGRIAYPTDKPEDKDQATPAAQTLPRPGDAAEPRPASA